MSDIHTLVACHGCTLGVRMRDAIVVDDWPYCHSCARGWLWAMVKLEADNKRLTAERDEAYKLLHDLTPMGSEYVNNPKRCARWIEEQITWKHGNLVETHDRLNKALAERDEALNEIERLRAALTQFANPDNWTDHFPTVDYTDATWWEGNGNPQQIARKALEAKG